MRARIAALVLFSLLIAGSAGAVGFLTQKELVGRDGDTLIVLPPYTYITVIRRFGEHAVINYRVGDIVHELRVGRSDLDAVRPDEIDGVPRSDREKLAAFYRKAAKGTRPQVAFPAVPGFPERAREPVTRNHAQPCNLLHHRAYYRLSAYETVQAGRSTR